MSAPDPKARMVSALTRLRKRIDKITDATVIILKDNEATQQTAQVVDIIEQGRDAITDLVEVVSAASIVLYKTQENR